MGAAGLAVAGASLATMSRAGVVEPARVVDPYRRRGLGVTAAVSLAATVVCALVSISLSGSVDQTVWRLALTISAGLIAVGAIALAGALLRQAEVVAELRRMAAPERPGLGVARLAPLALAATLSSLPPLFLLVVYLWTGGSVVLLLWVALAPVVVAGIWSATVARSVVRGTRDRAAETLGLLAGHFADFLLVVPAAMALAFLNPLTYRLFPGAILFPLFLAAWVGLSSWVGALAVGSGVATGPRERLVLGLATTVMVSLVGLFYFDLVVMGGNLAFWVTPALGLFCGMAALAVPRESRSGGLTGLGGLSVVALLAGGLVGSFLVGGWNLSWSHPSFNLSLEVYGVGLWAVALVALSSCVLASLAFEQVLRPRIPASAAALPIEGEGSRLVVDGLPHVRGDIFSIVSALAAGWVVVWVYVWLTAVSAQTSLEFVLGSVTLGVPSFLGGLIAGGGLPLVVLHSRGAGSANTPGTPDPREWRAGPTAVAAGIVAVVVGGLIGGPTAVIGILSGVLISGMAVGLQSNGPPVGSADPASSARIGDLPAEEASFGWRGRGLVYPMLIRSTSAAALVFAFAIAARSLVGIP